MIEEGMRALREQGEEGKAFLIGILLTGGACACILCAIGVAVLLMKKSGEEETRKNMNKRISGASLAF